MNFIIKFHYKIKKTSRKESSKRKYVGSRFETVRSSMTFRNENENDEKPSATTFVVKNEYNLWELVITA